MITCDNVPYIFFCTMYLSYCTELSKPKMLLKIKIIYLARTFLREYINVYHDFSDTIYFNKIREI